MLCAVLAPWSATAQEEAPAPQPEVTSPEETWAPTDRASEAALGLKRADIAEIQAQLTAMGHDPKGIDGVMGQGTRKALAVWQESQAMPATGYLDARQRDMLQAASMIDYAIWLGVPENKALLEKAAKPAQAKSRTLRNGWYRDSRGRYCKRILVGAWCQKSRPQSLR